MTPEQLNEIEARANHATQGPWVWEATSPRMSGEQWNLRISDKPGIRMMVSEYQHGTANAEFIAAARTDVPQLVAEVRRLRSQTQQLLTDLKTATDSQYSRNLVIMRLRQTLGESDE